MEESNTQLILHKPLLNLPELTLEVINKSPIQSEHKEVIVSAYNFPKIKRLDIRHTINVKNEIIEVEGTEDFISLQRIVITAIWETGYNIEESELTLLAPKIVSDIAKHFKNLTLEEIKIALEKGVRDEYGQFYGLNVRTFHLWIKSYVEGKKEAMKSLQRFQQQILRNKKISTEEIIEIKRRWIDNIIKSYNHFKNTDEFNFDDTGNIFFNLLKKHNVYQLDKEEKAIILNQSEEEFKKKREAGQAQNKDERKQFLEELKKLEEKDLSSIEKIKCQARKMSIENVFRMATLEEEGVFEKTLIDIHNKEVKEITLERKKQSKN